MPDHSNPVDAGQHERLHGRLLDDALARLLPGLTVAARAAGPELAAQLPDLLEAVADPPARAAVARLAAGFGLSAFEVDLLVLAGLPEEHETLTHLARRAHPRGEAASCPAAAATILALDAAGRRHLRAAVEAGPLRRHGLLTGMADVPLPERSLRLPPGLWSVIRGLDHWPDAITPVPVRPATPNGDTPALDPLRRALAGDQPRVVVVSGGTRVSAAQAAATVTGALDHLAVRWVALPAETVVGATADLASAHLVARGAVPVVVGAAAGTPLPRHPGPVLTCVESTPALAGDDRPVAYLPWRPGGLGEAAGMWSELLPELNGQADELAGLLRVDGLGASRAVADARLTARVEDRPLSAGAVVHQVRRRTDVTLPASVRLVRPTAHWTDLVLENQQEAALRSVVDRVRGQVRVLHEWGFAGARGTRGVRLLLSGPPGTGKTLATEVLAADLGLDLLVVDLASLVSKWLGETEKNIGEVFDAAERCQSVLLFDEADAVFGRRTDGGDAQGRWANLETAYLLSRVDRFEGLVCLATNLRGHIDDAFVRRLDVIVELEEPEVEARTRIWHSHLPASAPYAPDVDVAVLAALYPVSGALIRNAALTAAFGAAARGSSIDQHGLVSAMRAEYLKSGRSFPGVPRTLQPSRRKGT